MMSEICLKIIQFGEQWVEVGGAQVKQSGHELIKVEIKFFFLREQFFMDLFLFIYFSCAGSLLLWGLFSSCSKQGILFLVAVLGLLNAVASLAAEHAL